MEHSTSFSAKGKESSLINSTATFNCHSPTQPQLELELDLIMGRKPPPHPTQELKKSRWNKKRVGGTKKETVEQKKSRWNKKRVGGTKQESVEQK